MQTEGCSSLEPGVGIEPTSVIHCCWMFTAGCCELVICSPPPEPFGLRWKSLTKASPTPALRSLAPGNFDGSTIALYKPSRKKSNSQLHSATGSFVQRIRSGHIGHIGRFGTEGSRRISKGETAEGIHGSPNPDAPNRSESDS